ncbi:MAG: hypothetical protein Q6363_006885, partial [Candidatus Njordarchaeota archaeon]
LGMLSNPHHPQDITPLIGRYDSLDDATIETHIALLERLVDFVIFSWWGANTYSDIVLEKFLLKIRELKSNLKVIIMIEPRLGNNPVVYDDDFWNETLAYLNTKYLTTFKDVMFYDKFQKAYILACFFPVGMIKKPAKYGEYIIRYIHAYPPITTQWYLYCTDKYIITEDGYISISPRVIVDKNDPIKLYYNPNLNKTEIQKTIDFVKKHKNEIRYLIIYSWNEFYERSYIEPAYEGNRDLSWLYNIFLNLTSELRK